MGKNPAFQFYPDAWVRDLQAHPLEIAGAWIRLLCQMHYNTEERRQITGTFAEYGKLLGVSEDDACRLVLYLVKNKLCNSQPSRVTPRSKKVTLICRRWDGEEKENEAHRLRQQRYREKRGGDAKVTSLLLSSSSKRGRIPPLTPPLQERATCPPDKSKATRCFNRGGRGSQCEHGLNSTCDWCLDNLSPAPTGG